MIQGFYKHICDVCYKETIYQRGSCLAGGNLPPDTIFYTFYGMDVCDECRQKVYDAIDPVVKELRNAIR
jgi:hypothetical protein